MCERSDKCHAKKSNGQLCENWAGAGTGHKGMGHCKRHGGASPNSEKAAARKTVANLVADSNLQVDPGEGLVKLMGISWTALGYFTQKLEEFPDKSLTVSGEDRQGREYNRPSEYAMWLKLYNEERDRAAGLSKLAITAGIAERQVRLLESQGAMIANAVRAILDRMLLTPEQKALAPSVVRDVLLAVDVKATELPNS